MKCRFTPFIPYIPDFYGHIITNRDKRFSIIKIFNFVYGSSMTKERKNTLLRIDIPQLDTFITTTSNKLFRVWRKIYIRYGFLVTILNGKALLNLKEFYL